MAKVKGDQPAPGEFDGLQGAGSSVAQPSEDAAYEYAGDQEPAGDPLEEQFGIPSFKLNDKAEGTEEAEGEGEEVTTESPSVVPEAAAPKSKDVQLDQASIEKAMSDWVNQQTQQPQMSQQLLDQLQALQKLTGQQPTQLDLKNLRQQILERSGNDQVLVDAIMHTVEQVMPAIQQQIQYESAMRAANLIQIREGITQATQQIRNAFYTANPDLKGFENVVGYMSNYYERMYPNAPKEQLMPMIAQASRNQIGELKKQLGYSPKTQPRKSGSLGGGARTVRSVPQSPSPQNNGKGNITREEKTQSERHLSDLVDFVNTRGFVS